MTEEVFVPVEKVAEHFCVKVHTIRSWVRQEHIPRTAYIKVGNTYRFSLPRIIDALTAKNGGIMKDPEPETAPIQQEPVEEQEQEFDPVKLEVAFNADDDV